MQTVTVTEAVERIGNAECDTDIRTTRRIEIGHAIQQGDVYVHRVPDSHPHGKRIGKGTVQVALGTGNGARHCAEGAVEVFEGTSLPEGVAAPMDVEAAEIIGPVVLAREAWTLTHPEHPHHRMPAGVYQVTYQYDPKTMRRVQD